jgi:Tfp pilus assembly protein PilF
MKKNILFSVISLLFCLSAYGQSFKLDFQAALRAKDLVKAEKILETWDLADANDSELYISYFNFYTIKSLEKDSTVYEKEYTDKALTFISEGIERFPTRFDMRIGKIYMLGSIKEYSAYTDEVINIINYSVKIDNNWKGDNFRLLENPVEMFEDAVLEFQGRLLAENDVSLFKNIIQISSEMLKCYPNDIQSRINLSTIYIKQKEYDKSIETLKKAITIDEKNPIVSYNLAYVYSLKGDKVNAKKYFELTVVNAEGKEEKLKSIAQQQLDAMK